jgi:hypothetical protein
MCLMKCLDFLSKKQLPGMVLSLALAWTSVEQARSAEPAPSDTATATTPSDEKPVASTTPDRTALVDRIDALLEKQWQAEGVEPAPPASDSEFLRRAYLDLIGVIPRVSDVRAFLADERPDKRELLIEQLLDSPRYATHMATTWRNRLIPFGADPPPASQTLGLQNWLRDQFAINRRYNGIVGDLLVTTAGDALGPALFFQTYDLAPEKLAKSSAELFLGMRLHCAQCHDHPYADWTQEDFWGLAAFFAQVRRPERAPPGSIYRLIDTKMGEAKLPATETVVPPKYLGGPRADQSDGGTRRQQLAIWMVSRDNPYMARSAVNWAWAHLFGRGIVDPVGDAGIHNPPSHPQLLDELAQEFTRSGFDIKELWRTLARTRAYGLSSQLSETELPAPELFAYMQTKAFTPEQLYDSVTRAAPPANQAAGAYNQPAALDVTGGAMDPRRVEFVRRMRSPAISPTEFSAGILQALTVMNGSVMADVTGSTSGLLGALDAPFMSDEDQIDALYLATLSRMPRAGELQASVTYLTDPTAGSDRHAALSDVLWALLNSSEFTFNH